MAINVKKIVVGGKAFTEANRKSPQESAKIEKSVKSEPIVEEEPITSTTAGFILKSSSKFHRDMID